MVWRFAGIVGINPGPLTLRELWQMAEERQRDQWSHTSVLLAVLANIHRDPKRTSRYTSEDFNPFSVRRSVSMKAEIGVLKQVFVDNRSGEGL